MCILSRALLSSTCSFSGGGPPPFLNSMSPGSNSTEPTSPVFRDDTLISKHLLSSATKEGEHMTFYCLTLLLPLYHPRCSSGPPKGDAALFETTRFRRYHNCATAAEEGEEHTFGNCRNCRNVYCSTRASQTYHERPAGPRQCRFSPTAAAIG